MNVTDLLHYTRYNAWANRLLCGFVLAAGEPVADAPMQSSFPTIRKTLDHITAAQDIWRLRLTVDPNPGWTGPGPEPIGACCRKLIDSSDRFAGMVGALTDEDLAGAQAYFSFKGDSFTNRRDHIVMHCMNHSTFHRGQVITMLRTAGFDRFVSTDYIAYCREVDRL